MKRSQRVLGVLFALAMGGCTGTQGSQQTALAPQTGTPSQVQPEVVASQQTANGREMPVMGQAPAPPATPPEAAHAQAETTEAPAAGEPGSETPAPTKTHHHHRRHHHRRHHHHHKAAPAAAEPAAAEPAPAPAASPAP